MIYEKKKFFGAQSSEIWNFGQFPEIELNFWRLFGFIGCVRKVFEKYFEGF